MNWFQLFFAAVKLAMMAEKYFKDKPKSGAEKNEMVMSGMKAVVDGVQTMSTGGQAETWDKIEAPVKEVVDLACGVMFKK